jgi:hypothetical protein
VTSDLNSAARPPTGDRSGLRIAGVVLVFLGLLGLVIAVTAAIRPLPAPAAGGTCGPGKGSESAIAAFFNPGSIGAGAQPKSPTEAVLQWMAFVGQCQSSTDARMLQALGILVLALVLAVIGGLMIRAAGRRPARVRASSPDAAPAAGWYPDPSPAATGTRWWDGGRWGPARPATVEATELRSSAPGSTMVIEARPETSVLASGPPGADPAAPPVGPVPPPAAWPGEPANPAPPTPVPPFPTYPDDVWAPNPAPSPGPGPAGGDAPDPTRPSEPAWPGDQAPGDQAPGDHPSANPPPADPPPPARPPWADS